MGSGEFEVLATQVCLFALIIIYIYYIWYLSCLFAVHVRGSWLSLSTMSFPRFRPVFSSWQCNLPCHYAQRLSVALIVICNVDYITCYLWLNLSKFSRARACFMEFELSLSSNICILIVVQSSRLSCSISLLSNFLFCFY